MKRLKLTQDYFINQANIVHNGKYDYSKVEILKNKKISIICKKHGVFEKNPHNHLYGQGCPICFKESQIKNHNTFINELKTKNPNLTILGEYINSYTKILIKDENNLEYLCTPNCLLSKKNLSIKTCTNPTLYFINKANHIHNNKYNYYLTKYVNSCSKITIKCNTHGLFYQNPSSHLTGQGCPSCNKYGFNRKAWINFCKDKKCETPIVYIIKCYNSEESFIKIGLTSQKIDRRFHSILSMPYSYEIIQTIEGDPLFIWNKEKELHRLYKKNKYNPLLDFPGKTECFSIDIMNVSYS